MTSPCDDLTFVNDGKERTKLGNIIGQEMKSEKELSNGSGHHYAP